MKHDLPWWQITLPTDSYSTWCIFKKYVASTVLFPRDFSRSPRRLNETKNGKEGGKKRREGKIRDPKELACVMGAARWFHPRRCLMAPPVAIYEWLTRSRTINKSMQRIIRRGSCCQVVVINIVSSLGPEVHATRVSAARCFFFGSYVNSRFPMFLRQEGYFHLLICPFVPGLAKG